MAYRVKALKDNSHRAWKLQWCTYKNGRRQDKDIPEHEWRRLGFSRSMTIEDAQRRKAQLNAQEHITRSEAKRAAISAKLAEEELVLSAFLQPADVASFEAEVLYGRDMVASRRNKTSSHWRAAKRLLCELRIDPSDYSQNKTRFYDWFSKNAFSPAYVQKLVRILNQWGAWQCRKYRRFFDPLPSPRGIEQQRIADRYFDSERGMESLPIGPSHLQALVGQLSEPLWNWLYLSVWLGLRPVEIDSLHSSNSYRIEQQGVPVLFVYQTKLVAVAREKRWKCIPCIYPEQLHALTIIKQCLFKRPSATAMHAHFPRGTTLYGGRKGFTDLMLGLGQKLEDISTWLGHTTIERTWRSYKNRQVVSYTPPLVKK